MPDSVRLAGCGLRRFYVIVTPMRNFFLAVALLAFVNSGCQWNQGPEELQRLVKEDPYFKGMIVQKNQARGQIGAIKQDLLDKKRIVDARAEKLRAEYDAYAKAQNLKIDQYNLSIDANRGKLRNQITSAEAEIEAKQTELEGYQRTLVDVQKVLRESKGITFSTQEQKKWEERVLMLSEKIRPLSEEIQELKLQIRLKKQKISYLD